jgi:endo-1,4-beta-xylanase
MQKLFLTRRTFLTKLGTVVGVTFFASQKIDTAYSQEAALRDRAAAKGLIYGAATQPDELKKEADFAASFAQECNALVQIHHLKMAPLRPSPTSYNFAQADALLEFAQSKSMYFRGHALVWHSQLPAWFQANVNSQNAKQILTDHITTVVGRYAGKVHSWDVANEVINPADGRPDGLRNTPWLQLLGPEHIDLAFRTAAVADPKAILMYNDFGLDYDVPAQEAKRAAVLKFLEDLKSKGTPIHAFGMQAHLNANSQRFSASRLQSFFQNIASMGLKIMITELDVQDQSLPADITARDAAVAKHYEDYLTVALAEKATLGVLTWGLSDRHTWLSSFAPRADNLPVRVLPLDADLRRKPAWSAIARAFDNAPPR